MENRPLQNEQNVLREKRTAYRAMRDAARLRDGRTRGYAGYANRGQPKKEDGIFGILMMQIGICVAVLVVCAAIKYKGGDLFIAAKSTFEGMMSQSMTASEFFEGFSDLNSFFQHIKETVVNIFSPETGDAPSKVVSTYTDLTDETVQMEEPASTKVQQNLLPDETDEEEELDLSGWGEAKEVGLSLRNGMGGMGEVENPSGERLSPPDYATFSPAVLSGCLFTPVIGELSSNYGYRLHPITGKLDFHNGVDIAAAMGANIRCVLPGTVDEVGESEIFGNYIVIRHSDSLKTMYGHCSEILAEEGAVIRRGENIAKVGSTGVSTGPHLHFTIYINDISIDPTEFLSYAV